MKKEIKVGQLIFEKGELDAMQYSKWERPGVITKVTNTIFTIINFEDFKAVEHEKADYPDLEKDGSAWIKAGRYDSYKNQIWLWSINEAAFKKFFASQNEKIRIQIQQHIPHLV